MEINPKPPESLSLSVSAKMNNDTGAHGHCYRFAIRHFENRRGEGPGDDVVDLLGFNDLGRSGPLLFFSETDFVYNYLHIVQK